mgnify:CR=1 FL=1
MRGVFVDIKFLRTMHGCSSEITIIPLDGEDFGPSLRSCDSLDYYNASALMFPGSGSCEIIVAQSTDAIRRYADMHQRVKIDQIQGWCDSG